MIHYPVPVHLQEAYDFLGLGAGSYPLAERLASEIVTLPMYPELSEDQARAVVDAVLHIHSGLHVELLRKRGILARC